jgi:hypothetical protein
MQAKRGKDFSAAASAICKNKDIGTLVGTLVDLLFRQFGAFHTYAAVRRNAHGAMEASKGRKISGEGVKLEEIRLAAKISEAVKNRYYILIPRLPAAKEGGEKIGSALIAPVMCEGECFGVLYADSSLDHECYGQNDLDYLILISLMTGAFVKNI